MRENVSESDLEVKLVDVRLLGVPLDLHAAASEHQDDLQREFVLIAESGEPDSVPPRLLKLVRELQDRFGSFSGGPYEEMDEAIKRGESSIDVLFRVPVEAAGAAEELSEMLDLVDDYCSAGQTLLTLTSPPPLVAYRNWFIGEFVRQINGESPLPWPGTGVGGRA